MKAKAWTAFLYAFVNKTNFQNNKNSTKAVAIANNIKSYHIKKEYAKEFSKNNRYCLFCSIDAMLGFDYDMLS